MPNFIFAYHGGKKPDTPEEGAAFMQQWRDWVASVGDALQGPGTFFKMSKTVSAEGVADGGAPDPLSGFSVVIADDMDAAIAIAESCPHTTHGTIEVAEMVEMPT